ncbi:MAG: hypothetical protein EAZ77_00370 [Nostocales cyanobacterium]|nr:MAG: hypothetical protein EAZ77_00370 [Nostocales cyanobacterium]
MQLNRRKYTCLSVLALAAFGSAVTWMQLTTPAIAGESIQRCMRSLMNDGITETNAAIACRDQRDQDWSNDRNRDESLELRARSGPTVEGRWRYSTPGVPDDAMIRAGCEKINRDDWRCNSSRLRVFFQNHHSQNIELQARSGPTVEGRWRYSTPGVPDDAMIRAGCEKINRNDWRCNSSRLRVFP